MPTLYEIWSSTASHLICECVDMCKPYIDKNYNGLNPLVRFVSTQLFLDCHFSSESVLILIAHRKEWDADLLSRSVLEGTLKYTYLMHGTENDRLEKTNEYWEVIPNLMELNRNSRVKKILDFFDGYEKEEWKPLSELLLTESRLDLIKNKYDKKQRNAILQKWSFSEIGKYFVSLNDKRFHSLALMAHGYGMNSHLVHKDGDGVGMVWDRSQRDDQRKEAVTIAHCARIISDLCNFAFLRSTFLYKACGFNKFPTENFEKKYSELFRDLEKAQSYFMEIEYGNDYNEEK